MCPNKKGDIKLMVKTSCGGLPNRAPVLFRDPSTTDQIMQATIYLILRTFYCSLTHMFLYHELQ